MIPILATVLALVEDPVEVMQRVLHIIYKKQVAPGALMPIFTKRSEK